MSRPVQAADITVEGLVTEWEPISFNEIMAMECKSWQSTTAAVKRKQFAMATADKCSESNSQVDSSQPTHIQLLC